MRNSIFHRYDGKQSQPLLLSQQLQVWVVGLQGKHPQSL